MVDCVMLRSETTKHFLGCQPLDSSVATLPQNDTAEVIFKADPTTELQSAGRRKYGGFSVLLSVNYQNFSVPSASPW